VHVKPEYDASAARPWPSVKKPVCARVAARLLALAAAIWHNWRIGATVKRSLIAHDH
jgi:hypothetical protein